jgi:glycosyltransferase involved in cell wall biosynthesis
MRILIVHSAHASAVPSGENVVFEDETRMLRSHGHGVETICRSVDVLRNQGLTGQIQGALLTPWNPWAARKVLARARAFEPDVVHVHNTFPMFSPALFHALRGVAARVLTLHNYRIFCPNGIPMRDGRTCTKCLDRRSVLPALQHGCYRQSRLATLPVAASVMLHRALGTWQHEVDGYVALTAFQRSTLVEAGLPPERVHVKPNFFPGTPSVHPWTERADRIVFVGRLSAEKGLRTLLKAWRLWGDSAPTLHLIGDGPLRAELERDAPETVRFLGMMPTDRAHEEIAHARLLVLPSECWEGFPMVLREAFAFGTPTAVSSLGPLPGLVESQGAGVVFEAAQPESLLSTVRDAWHNDARMRRMSERARKLYEAHYRESANVEQLLDIYRRSISQAAQHVHRSP